MLILQSGSTLVVRQGDSLSPTLFGLFINDLMSKIKTLNLGVNINDIIISILAFGDDIVIIAQKKKNYKISYIVSKNGVKMEFKNKCRQNKCSSF